MKKYVNFKNIAIAVLVIWILLQWFNPGGVMPGGRTIRIDGKKYEVIIVTGKQIGRAHV